MTCLRFLPAVVVLLLSTQNGFAAEELSVKDVLARPLMDPQLPLQEVQAYTESRVLPMPELTAVQDWETFANRTRQQVLDHVVFRGEAARWRKQPTTVEWLETIPGGPGYHIRKLRFEIVPGMWTAALLYEPDQLDGQVPVIMNVNGHDRKDGKAAKYKQIRCINQAQRGMLALNVEWLGMGQLNTPGFGHYSMNQLNLCGTSGLAPFYLAMSRGLDLLLQHPHADPQRVGVAGLSGGGWQTIVISALDPRVTFCNPVAGYSSFRTRARFLSDLGDSEQTPCDLARYTDYSQLTAMLAPRPALLTKNAEDQCCFKAAHALPPLLEAAQPAYRLYGQAGNLRYHVNHVPGTHNFELDNRQQLYRALGDYFYPDDPDYQDQEISCEDQVRTHEQLFVELPSDNLDFNSLALQLSDQLQRTLPESRAELEKWQKPLRSVLSELVRERPLELLPIEQARHSTANGTAIWRWLRMDGDWTVPCVEITTPQADPGKIAIVLNDEGRAASIMDVSILLSSGHRVLAIDPFYFGESRIAERDFLFATLVASLGDRPLGIQAGQLRSVARWARDELQATSVRVVSSGPRTSLIALVAAALDEHEIDRVETFGCRGSLRQLIEQNLGMNQVPESLCFGLLEHFDIVQLAAMVEPRPVLFHEADARLTDELQPLQQRLTD